MLGLQRLHVLRETARAGSISAAARALSFTPSAVSQQLAKLEREAGAQLLVRTARGVSLTAAGERLVAHADDLLARVAAVEAEVRELAGQRPALRIGSFPTAGATILPPALAELSRLHPHVQLSVLALDPAESLARLSAGELDLALVFEYDHVPLPRDARIELVPLLEEPMRVVLPAGHAHARRPAVVLAELAGETWMRSSPRSSCHPFTERACAAAGFTPRIALEFDDYNALQSLVAAGVGVGFAPASALERPHPGVVARPVAFHAPARRIFAARLAVRPPRPADASLLAALARASRPRGPLGAAAPAG